MLADRCPKCGELGHCGAALNALADALAWRDLVRDAIKRGRADRERCRELIVLACEEAWDTPGDEWGIPGRTGSVIKTNGQIANEIADRLLGEPDV
jgi:hypothetical protein